MAHRSVGNPNVIWSIIEGKIGNYTLSPSTFVKKMNKYLAALDAFFSRGRFFFFALPVNQLRNIPNLFATS